MYAQNVISRDSATIEKRYKAYFPEDRKVVHLHLNKTTFGSGEYVWFSSYIFNKKLNSISPEDEYVYIDLLDCKGAVIDSKTILSPNGKGIGEFYLDPDLVSGNYYLQAHTLAMNSYAEDDSTVFPIRVINFESGNFPTKISNAHTLNMVLQPESGALVQDVFGTCGIQILSDEGEPIVADSVFVISSKSDRKHAIFPNSLGISQFSLTPKRGAAYAVWAYYRDQVIKQQMPKAKEMGYTISTSHNFSRKQLLVSIRTNHKTWSQDPKKLSLLIHKDGGIFSVPVQVEKDENKGLSQDIILPYSMLFLGINTLSLVAEAGLVLAERLVFNKPHTIDLYPQLLKVDRINDSISVYIKHNNIKSEKINGLISSVSVLPNETTQIPKRKNIMTSFYLQNYFRSSIYSDWLDWDDLMDEKAQYNFDMLLLMKNSGRYKWSNILKKKSQLPGKPSSNSYLQGYVNLFDEKNDSLSVMLFSQENNLFEVTALDNEEKFEFQNLNLKKESKISLTLLDKSGAPVHANFFFTEHPTPKPYRYRYIPPSRETNFSNSEIRQSFIKKAEALEEVTVTGNVLKREKFFGEFNGRKVDSTLQSTITLGGYMQTLGYRMRFVDPLYPDPKRAGSYQLYRSCWIRAQEIFLYPSISFDGVFTGYAKDYANIRMEHIDEIYYLKKSRCDAGVLVVFSKKEYRNRPIPEYKKDSKEFIVHHGYDAPSAFIRPLYYSTETSLFKKYGITSWMPNLTSNEQSVISFKIPDDHLDQLKMHIEGFLDSGEILSHSLIVDLNNSAN